MNRFERRIYDLVKDNTTLKNFLRDKYQGVLSCIPTKKIESSYKITEREGYFFGFHDKIPWSADNSKLLAHKYDISNREVMPKDTIVIGYFHGDRFLEFKSLRRTRAWNWQQGSMLQWVGNKNSIIYNDWNGNKNVAKIINVEGELIKELGWPIGAIDNNGKYGISYSFERLNRGMYGYGYTNENDSEENNTTSKTSGLRRIDLETGESNFLFSIDDIKNINFDDNLCDGYHFFTHCLFSPKGDRFVFLHRCYREGRRLFSRMISSDLNGNNLNIFPTNGMVSHMTWVDNDNILAYCSTKQYGDGYFLFKDFSSEFEKVGGVHYKSDGHPQYCQNNGLIVTDTYPDRFRIQELSIYNIKTKEKKVIAKLKSPRNFKNAVRCDLHPRWDREGKMLCFDSAHTGRRSLCTISLER